MLRGKYPERLQGEALTRLSKSPSLSRLIWTGNFSVRPTLSSVVATCYMGLLNN